MLESAMRNIVRTPSIDTIDRSILRRLQADGRMTNADLAVAIGLSPAACHKRLKRLEEDGVIEGYAAIVSRSAINLAQSVFVQITLESQGREELEAFERAVAQCSRIVECHLMTGDQDYLLHVVVQDAADYEQLHKDVLTTLPGVDRLRSSFSLRTVRRRAALPIGV